MTSRFLERAVDFQEKKDAFCVKRWPPRKKGKQNGQSTFFTSVIDGSVMFYEKKREVGA